MAADRHAAQHGRHPPPPKKKLLQNKTEKREAILWHQHRKQLSNYLLYAVRKLSLIISQLTWHNRLIAYIKQQLDKRVVAASKKETFPLSSLLRGGTDFCSLTTRCRQNLHLSAYSPNCFKLISYL